MLKFIITLLLLLFISNSLFSQRLCEESMPLHSLHKTNEENVILVSSYRKLYWYNVESCEFIDSLAYNTGPSARRTKITHDRTKLLVWFQDSNVLDVLRLYNLETKEVEKDYNVDLIDDDADKNGFDLSSINSFFVVSGRDNRLSEYDLNSGELVKYKVTLSPGLSHLKVSPNGNLLGIISYNNDYGHILHIYNAHTLELIQSINFRDYFEELDIQINSGFEFDPVSNDIYLGSDKKLIRYDFESKQTTTILEQYRIRSSNMSFSETGDTLIVDFKPEGVNTEIGVVNVNSKDDFYTLPGFSYWAISYEDFVIVANGNSSRNIFKLSLITNIEESETNQLSIFPNPSTGNINVSFDNLQANRIQIKLFNINGELIEILYDDINIEPIFNMVFDIGNNPNGSYLLEIKIGENKYVENIILEK